MGAVRDLLNTRAKNRLRLQKEVRCRTIASTRCSKRVYQEGAITLKNKELMAVAASVATRCVPCLANHASNAVAAGATRQEVLEAAGIGVEFGGGPSFIVIRDNLHPIPR